MSDSSKKWLARQKKDPYVKLSHKEGVRSRAVYKLREIQDKHRVISKGMRIMELGAAPGSWTMEIASWVGKSGEIFAVDRLPMAEIKDVKIVCVDIETEEFKKWLEKTIAPDGVDVVVSDMAPDMCGHKQTDQLRSTGLCESVSDIAQASLRNGGSLLMKAFHGIGFDELVKQLRKKFKVVKLVKPDASRRSATEMYILAKGFLKSNSSGSAKYGE
ncbi:MAG: RlmE family RNA methyltransferase [Pseudomonadota bacterium]|nr:RlmE family RNA methyltransferase [Pseudomonadota bacterium]